MKLVTGTQMQAIDKQAIQEYGIASLQLMEQAGVAIYQQFISMFQKDKKIIIVCGSGNNGGDGLVLARLLATDGYRVAVWLVGSIQHLSADCQTNLDLYQDLHFDFVEALDAADILVDAIFGTGLSRTVQGRYEAIIKQINQHSAIKVAIDIPSGIDSTSGAVLGSAVFADYTFTLQTGKLGLYIYPGRTQCGDTVVLDIGIPKILIEQCESNMYLIEKQNMHTLLPKRFMHSNKGSYGKVLCIGGSDGMSGAISLAALSALRSGCGMVTCAIPKSIQNVVSGNVLESMSIALPETEGHIDQRASQILQTKIHKFDCVLIGCGIGRSDDIKVVLKMLLDSDKPLLIDADALYALKELLPAYAKRKNIIITPHLKEFAWLVDKKVKDIVENSLTEALAFTKKYPNITLVLKSETTLIVKGDKVYVNTYGNNGLAKGGSGDVLAGVITGLFAQQKQTLEAGILGVFLHAYSADQLLETQSVYSILPTDVLKQIDAVILQIEESL